MKKVIIGIHGLGNKPPEDQLKQWWLDAIREGLRKQNTETDLPVFELVYWADILHDKPLSKWEKDEESPYFLDEPYLVSPENFVVEDHSLRRKVISFISDQLNRIFLDEDKTLNYTFISDYILHNYFRDLETYYAEESINENNVSCKAKDRIIQRLADMLMKYRDHEILLIAHSMGSIIAFDAMTFTVPEVKVNTLVTIGSPLGLPVVISRIAAEYKKFNDETNFMTTPACIKKYWYNLADISDVVAIHYKLSDDFSANEKGVLPIDFQVINDYMAGDKRNPHKSYGYLRTPEMAKAINEFIEEKKWDVAGWIVKNLGRLLDNLRAKE